MCLSIKQSALLIVSSSILLLFSGCSKTSYSYGNYNYAPSSPSSSSLSTSKKYVDIPKEQIRNSQAMHRATMRPYQVFGKWYHPTLAKVGDIEHGIASWYGPNFHSKKTSNGEIYNMYASTAAHKTLPMNTMVKVFNLDNGKSTIVRINDRGPFVDGRIIDLSNKAAHDVDMVKSGTAKVKIQILGFHAKIATTQDELNEVATVGQYFVQVGAFRRSEGARITQRKFKLILQSQYDVITKEGTLDEKPIYRVWVSGFRSEEEAKDFRDKNDLKGAMIIAQ